MNDIPEEDYPDYYDEPTDAEMAWETLEEEMEEEIED